MRRKPSAKQGTFVHVTENEGKAAGLNQSGTAERIAGFVSSAETEPVLYIAGRPRQAESRFFIRRKEESNGNHFLYS